MDHREEIPEGGKRDVHDTGKDPSPAFKAALQAFAGYVAWIHSWPEDAVERIDVRGVSIKRPDDAPRGINVTALLKCARARNSTSTINTPFLSEPPDGYNGDRSGFLPESTVTLIGALEERASEYVAGERGEQTTLPLGDSENSKAFNDRSAAAEVSSTRKPKGKKSKGFIPGVGDVINADASLMNDDDLRQLLLSVERDLPIDAVPLLTSSDRSLAIAWAQATLKATIGQIPKGDVPDEPEAVRKLAMAALAAGWTDPNPPRIDDNAAQEVAAAAEGAR